MSVYQNQLFGQNENRRPCWKHERLLKTLTTAPERVRGRTRELRTPLVLSPISKFCPSMAEL